MAEMIETRRYAGPEVRVELRTSDRGFQAYKILQIGFILAPTIAGLDKFFHFLVNWDQYLAPKIAERVPFGAHRFMLAVGVVEMAAGLLVAIKPKIGAYVVAAWLAAIVANLLILGGYFDIALRDFGLMLAALALGRLSRVYGGVRRTRAISTP